MHSRNVFPKSKRLTDADYRSLISKAVLRMSGEHGCDRLALEVGGVDGRTLRNARDEKATLSAVTLFNLLMHDDSALDELMAHCGKRIVDVDECGDAEARLLADTLALGAAHAEALADGRVDHVEEARLVKLARPVASAWGGRVARSGRAA